MGSQHITGVSRNTWLFSPLLSFPIHGVPAMPEVVTKLSLEAKDGRVRHNLCWILEQHYSRKWAKVRIDEEIARPTRSPWQRSNLKAAQEQYFADDKPIPPYKRYAPQP